MSNTPQTREEWMDRAKELLEKSMNEVHRPQLASEYANLASAVMKYVEMVYPSASVVRLDRE